jgi:molybdenum cofactor guanylyltransferase
VIPQDDITGVILAGGRGRRMGGADKGLVDFNGRPLVAQVIDAIFPQVRTLLISANRNLVRYQQFGYPVVADSIQDFQGPLAGILSALKMVQTPYIVTLPCDGPRLAGDLVERLATALQRENGEVAVAHDGERLQSAYALIPVNLRSNIEDYLASGERKLGLWLASHPMIEVDFSDNPSTFANINTEEDWQRLLQSDVS